MNELHNASGRVSTRASLWVLCTICILTLGLGYLSAALLPAAAPPVELTQDLAAIAPSHDAAPLADASYAPAAVSQPAPKPVAAAAPATKTVSTSVTLAPATTAPAKDAKAEAPVLLAQATPAGTFDLDTKERETTSAVPVAKSENGNDWSVIDVDARLLPVLKVPDNFLSSGERSAAQVFTTTEVEPNDTVATATPLGGSNLVAIGNLYVAPSGSDIDYWSFSATAGDRVYAAIQTAFSANGSVDSQLTLIASNGTTSIEFDDDDGSFGSFSSSIAGATIPTTGTYYLKVNHFTAGATLRPYYLHFRLQSGSPTAEVEGNDTPATATPLPANGWVSGTRGTTTDVDYYSFSLNAGDTVFLSLDMDPERNNLPAAGGWDGRLGIALFGDAGNQILVVNDTSTGGGTAANFLSEALMMTVKTAGTYYAYVDSTAAVGGATYTYTLSASVHPATPIGTNCTVYSSTDVPKTIGPAAGSVDSTITVPGNPRIEDLNVSITLTHALMVDIDAALISPAGNENSLFTDIGATATAGQTQMDIDLDDEAGIPPGFTVVKGMGYQPELSYRLGWFKGELAGGTWTLRLRDDLASNGGTLSAWSMTICEPPTPPVCSGTTVTVFSTNFDTNNGGFTTSSGTTAPWQYGTPTAAPINTCNSGASCWKTNLTGTYSASANQDLLSPTLNLSGLAAPVQVSWAQKYQMAGGAASAMADTFLVEIRQPGPTNARPLFRYLDATMTDSVGSPTTTLNETAGWGLVTRDVSSYAGQSVQLRWNFTSDASTNLAGLAIDDVTVTACCTAASCNDNNPCTDDICDPSLGCTHVNNNSNSCSDGNPCTNPDACVNGTCVAGPNPCNDSNACTIDVCDGAGGCTYTPVVCNDNNGCTDDSCNPATGCVFTNNSAPCNDLNPCTIGDVCSGGACVPGAPPAPVSFCNGASITINDVAAASPYPSSINVTGLPSYLCSTTVDLKGVTHTFIADVDAMVSHGTPNLIIMSDVGGSTAVTNVNLTLSDAAANSLPAGTIVSGTYKPTNITTGDGFAAPAPTPSAATTLATFTGTNPNGLWSLWVVDDATGDTGTIGQGWCVNVAAVCQANADCDDANSCTDDICSGGACTHTPNTGASCSDNNACTSGDACVNGTCTGTPTVCDDSDACTTDACDPATGNCVYTPVVCNDNNTCTDDACVSPTGCTYTPNDANSCTDHDACTQTDACVGGTCVGSNPVNCDDGNVCTTDACTPSTGACTHTPNTNACDDGNACTSPDVCGPNTTTIASEAFDGATAPALPSGWTSTQTGSGSLWVTSTATPDTAPNSALGADGTTVSDELLVSPVINITSASAKLSFRSRWTFENGSGNCYDAGVLEISINGGAFTDIVTAGGSFASGGYTGTVSSSFSNPLAGRSAWCAVSTGYPSYLTVNVNLPAAANGQPIQLRWRIGTDTSTGAAGQNVDTVSVTETFQVCSGSTVSCDDNDACTTDTCDPENGCQHAPVVCNDNNVCTTDSCDAATGCVYTPISCDDNDACTTDSCDPVDGCHHAPVVCNDGDACTTDTCDSATGCVYTPVSCDDGNACTLDACDPLNGCSHTPITCNDNDACTTDTCDPADGCHYAPVSCDDNNPCTDDGCDAASGCYHNNNTSPCSDNDACTENDTCANGACQPGTPVNCDDGNACTQDSCDPLTGCTHTPVSCDDNNPCTDDSCDPADGCHHADNTAPCSDNDACTENDTCSGGSCVGGPAVVCTDNNACTTDTCNPASGCVYLPNTDPCDDGNACTTGDVCGGGVCNPGGPTSCDDGNPCTDDGCNPATGCTHVNNTAPCNDNDACTTNDTCSGGACGGGAALDCNDNNPCTDDSCLPASGCHYENNTAPCSDGNACTTGDVCGDGSCHAGAPADCNDGNACTVDGCNPATGCTHDPLNCDDGNVCTADSCNPATGCVNVPVVCDDGNACTTDACVPGIGCVSTPIVCNDHNVCTDDTCNPATGCVYTPNTASCDDGNACTVDVCSNGSCGCPPVQACTPTSAHFDSTDVPKAIATTGTPTVTSTLTVSGVGTYLRDINVKTFITHTSDGQLQISIKSPAGTIVTLSSNNGGTLDNAFNGTVWDDGADPGNQAPFPGDTFAASNLVTDTVYTNLVVKPTLAPEEPLGAFIGENPNGVWTLTIADQTTGDGGNLANWSVDVATLAAAPPTQATTSYASTDVPKTIPTTAPPTTVTSNVTVAGAGSQIGRLRLKTFITHTFPGDIDMTLMAPSGRIVTITSDNAASNDDVFNGTLWDDKADPGNQVPYVVPFASSKMVTDTTYAISVIKTTLASEEGLSAFVGENPNGVWTLTISDDANLDGGSLVNWSLEITTEDCTASCNTNCDDGNPCTDDACDPATGCYHTNNTSPCNDGNACTTGDACGGGTCQGAPVTCNDGNVCTDDACNPANGQCQHTNNTNSCDDGNACTSGDVCSAPAVCGSSENFDGVTAPALPAGWTSTQTGAGSLWVTSSASSSSAPNSALGADGTAVSDELLVSPPIAITSATAQLSFRNRWSFESATSCFDAGVLEIKIGAGSFTDIVTAGGSFVTGGYTGTVSSSFSNPLAGRSAWCNASAGYPAYVTTTVNLPASAAGQTIQLRWRIGTDTSTGASGQNIDTITITDTCVASCHGGAPVNCDDGNVCTDDACNPATGCTHTNNTAPCDDGNACTTGDTCGGGSCQPGGPVTIPEVTNVVIGPGSVISWDPVPGAVYDVAAGTTNDLQINGVVNATCLANDVSIPTYTDPTVPSVDDGFFYLIRAQTACGNGGYGFDSGGAPRTPTSACP